MQEPAWTDAISSFRPFPGLGKMQHHRRHSFWAPLLCRRSLRGKILLLRL